MYLSVSNGDEYTHNLDGRYVKVNDYPDNLLFNTGTGVLTMEFGKTTPGAANNRSDVTVDLDGRYKKETDTDVAISALEWNATSGKIKADLNNGTSTALESLDGRYFDEFVQTGNSIEFKRNTGNSQTLTIPATQKYVPEGSKMLFAQAAAPCGWVKDTTHNNKALRVVTGNGGGDGGTKDFSTVFQNVSTGGSVGIGNIGASVGNGWATDWGSTTINHNFNIDGSISAGFDSASTINGSVNINGAPNINNNLSVTTGNMSIAGTYATNASLSISQIAQHWHNYYRPGQYGNADHDDGTVVRGEQSHTTSGNGGGGAHGHYIGGGYISGSPGFSGGIGANKGNLGAGHNLGVDGDVTVSGSSLDVDGNVVLSGTPGLGTGNINMNGAPSFTAGSIDMDVKYVDLIICTKDQSNGATCP